LREVLAYPQSVETFSVSAVSTALERFGLQRLLPKLDVSQRWDRELNEDEQQGLMFARLLMHAPRWVVMDEVVDAIDERLRGRVLDVFAKELESSTLLHISRKSASDPVFTRALHLIKDPRIRRIERRTGPAEVGVIPATP
jgi:putative ATP-binding cassette transporter